MATALRPVIERCLEKDPARRYQNAREVQLVLETIQSGLVPVWTTWRYQLTRPRGLVVTAAGRGGRGAYRPTERRRPSRSTGRNVNSAGPIKLAVLPFENLTGDPNQEYFSDGLTDEMITQLGRLQPDRLRVIARSSAMQYKNREEPLEAMARELGVDFVLEGSARREGNHIRINATLIQVRDRTQRWSQSFDRDWPGS